MNISSNNMKWLSGYTACTLSVDIGDSTRKLDIGTFQHFLEPV